MLMKKVGDKLIPKTEDEFDVEDIKKVENYAKAINMLYCAVNPDDYRKISCCSTAKEMWDKLEVTYEGTDQVREAKIDFLTQEYEMFRMKEHEKIDDMFDHFSKIVNDLHALKKTYTDRDLVRKILRSLTSEWRSKADAIYELIGTSNVTIDGLRGNLKTYESTILNPSLNDQRKGIALKAIKESTMDDSSDDDEVKLVMKKFCKLLRKKEKVEDGPVCYGCGEAGHIKKKCLKSGRNARHFKNQRAYISWGGNSGDESSEQEEDEEANLCLIAQEEEESDNGENQEGSLFPLVVRRKGIFLRVEVLECGISEQVLLRLVGLEFLGCNGLLSTRMAITTKKTCLIHDSSSEYYLHPSEGPGNALTKHVLKEDMAVSHLVEGEVAGTEEANLLPSRHLLPKACMEEKPDRRPIRQPRHPCPSLHYRPIMFLVSFVRQGVQL
ncbi:unnamed protein product [Cuscuta campestris]|uniref:CCHC-type domain-containing protein n=1 Tax=Cuscuta campestris TaxID=132261 RepID=A0A484LN43_9ASTE|nr:unnamed protein product [Cuscuta campestris]